MLDAMKYH